MKALKKGLCVFLSLFLVLPLTTANAENRDRKVKICHLDKDDPRQCSEEWVDEDEVPRHKKKGDYEGTCDDNDDEDHSSICFVPRENPTGCRTLNVPHKKLKAYLRQGSYPGDCDDKIVICKRSKNQEVDRSSLKEHLKNGAKIGYCDDTPDDDCSDGHYYEVCQYPGTKTQRTISVKSCRLKKYFDFDCKIKRCEETPTPAPTARPITSAPSTRTPGTQTPATQTPAPTINNEPYCGNGIREGEEACDDESETNNNRCLTNCQWAYCGDGHIRTGVEDCDPGNAEETTTCNRDCTLTQCGDGLLNQAAGEECDNGSLNGAIGGCSSTCKKQYNCGNGIKNTGEQCDLGQENSNSSWCLPKTCRQASCGDGNLFLGFEKCDDGNFVDTDSCTGDCQLPFCGDGITGPGEECDDGRGVNTGLCLSTCKRNICGDSWAHFGIEECDHGTLNAYNASCTSQCRLAFCGDGYVHTGTEDCDNGHLSNTSSCTPGCRNARCGDGFIQAGVEVCDQGSENGNGGGFCKSDCSGVQKPSIWTHGMIAGVVIGATIGLVGIVTALSIICYKCTHVGRTIFGGFKPTSVVPVGGAQQQQMDS